MSETKTTQLVLISAHFFTSASVEPEAMDAHLDALTERIRAHLSPLVEAESRIEAFAGFSYRYPGDPEENAGSCVSCGRWTTDVKEINAIDGLVFGSVVEGNLTCYECQMWQEIERERQAAP